MLGYVKIDKAELKVREYEIYCGYYCGICKSIGRRYGQLPRMALSYDAAFLALLLSSLNEEPDEPRTEHCAVHHIKKKTLIYNEAIDYSADVMLILTWYKLLDDAKDEGRLYAKTTGMLFKRKFKKLKAKHPYLCLEIEKNLKELSELENTRCDSIDMAAEAFSKIMESIFLQGVKTLYSDGRFSEEIKQIGYHLGKWIYMIDAVDDIEDNIKSGAYNPLLYRFRYDESTESAARFRKRIDGDLRFNLFHYLAVASNCLADLDIKKNQGIIDNIIYFGLNRKTEEILTRVEEKKRI